MSSQIDYLLGERRWIDTLSCGHTRNVVTFIGDFDRAAARVAELTRCFECWPPGKRAKLSTVSEVREVPVEEWDLPIDLGETLR